jgi:hypothetical protein
VRTVKLIDLMHKMYKHDKLTGDVGEALDGGLDRVSAAIADTVRQNVLNNATWFLSQKEKELGIDNDTNEVRLRRARVLARNIANGKCSVDMLKAMLDGFDLQADIVVGDMVLSFTLNGCEESKFIQQAMSEVDRITSAHLGIIYNTVSRPIDNIYTAIIPVTDRFEIVNPEYEDITAGNLVSVMYAGYLSEMRGEIIECEIITPVPGGGDDSGDVIGGVVLQGIVDEDIIGKITEQEE